MKVAFTGATGFLGRHAVPLLAEQNHHVRAISRSGRSVEGAAEVVQADVCDAAALAEAVQGCDVVVHAAGKVSHSLQDAALTWALHVQGSTNAVAACRAAGIGRMVYLSTSGTVAVSADLSAVGTEGDPEPLTTVQAWPYYRSKLFAEQAVLAAAGDGLEVVSLNPSLLLGPGDEPYGVSTQSVWMFLDDPIPLAPPGVLSFVDVRDVAAAIGLALVHGGSGRRYLLGGANLSFKDFYDKLARITGKPAPVAALPQATRRVLRWLPGLGRDAEIGFGAKLSRDELTLACHNWSVDSSRAQAELGWQARDPLETLEETVFDLLSKRRGDSGHHRR